MRDLWRSIEGVMAPAVGLAVHNTYFRAKMAQIAELLKPPLPLLVSTRVCRLLALLLAVATRLACSTDREGSINHWKEQKLAPSPRSPHAPTSAFGQ